MPFVDPKPASSIYYPIGITPPLTGPTFVYTNTIGNGYQKPPNDLVAEIVSEVVDTFGDEIVTPIISAFTEHVVEPITEFVSDIPNLEEVLSFVKGIANDPIKFYFDKVLEPMQKIFIASIYKIVGDEFLGSS